MSKKVKDMIDINIQLKNHLFSMIGIEISIESISRTAIGMTIKCNFIIPGPKLSGGYLTQVILFFMRPIQ